MGTSYTALSGSRGMIATRSLPSSGWKPHESPLSGLDEGPLEPGPRDVDLGRRLPVDLDRTLGDQAPRLARRAHVEVLDQESRQVDGIPRGQLRLWDVCRGLAFAHHSREVLLGLARGFRSVRAFDDEPRESELRLHRLAARRFLLHDEPVVGLQQLVGQTHGLAELLV